MAAFRYIRRLQAAMEPVIEARSRAEVLHEAADQLASLLDVAMWTGRENAGIDAYSGAAQVVDWLERRASEAEQHGSGEDQKRDEERPGQFSTPRNVRTR
jgi:hypothetical protein